MEELLFTPASLLDLLCKVDEFKDMEIGISETLDGKLQLQIGNSYYELEPEDEIAIDVPESDLNAVSEANVDTYNELSDNGIDVSDQPIESGIIKEALKALAIGGMIKLTAKLLK